MASLTHLTSEVCTFHDPVYSIPCTFAFSPLFLFTRWLPCYNHSRFEPNISFRFHCMSTHPTRSLPCLDILEADEMKKPTSGHCATEANAQHTGKPLILSLLSLKDQPKSNKTKFKGLVGCTFFPDAWVRLSTGHYFPQSGS